MLIDSVSKYLLKKTRSKAKMFEYNIPAELHIEVESNANELLLIAVAAIGNIAAEVLNESNPYRIVPSDKKAELEFASRYFDAFLNSTLAPRYDQYYLLLGAISYYFCDYIGSCKVMAKMIDWQNLELDCGGIEKVLTLLLQDDISLDKHMEFFQETLYGKDLLQIITAYHTIFIENKDSDKNFINDFRTFIYSHGSPRELLLTDALLAILLIKIERSALNLLPIYSGLTSSNWLGMLQNEKSIHELWPAQIRLGEAKVFSGKSAIIQMPTSSGKTTSMSIVIRSAFLSGRTKIAVVVAPFRALCREISFDIENHFKDNPDIHINELSDVLEIEDLLEMFESFGRESKNIMVLTPEKLIYLLRQDVDLIKSIGLVIFDEAHMFDDASRGARYELLISTVMMYLDDTTQKILVSAVIPNADQINNWLTKGTGSVVADNSIRASEKSIAITDWENHRDNQYGYLYFLDSDNRNSLEFFVPRVVEIQELNKFSKREKQRFFPEVNFQKGKVEHNDIAIYLSLKLNHNGGVAIFCGSKVTVDGVLKRILEIESRGVDITSFCNNIADDEHEKIARLIQENYGEANVYYEAAKKGVFAHHRGVSNGIRISIEYAMKENLIRCIVCTSTLAQGVNLPIRYLIVSNLYQAREKIKVRDFHNLIGRAGRAGHYTEGTILLSETFVYSRKSTRNESWKWSGYLEILDPHNSESCLSLLLLLVRPIKIYIDYTLTIQYDFYNMALGRYEDAENYQSRINNLEANFKVRYPLKIDELKNFIYQVNTCLDAIESYMLSFLAETDNPLNLEILLENTFGYFLADECEKQRLITIFSTVKDYLLSKVTDERKRTAFSRTLLGVRQLLSLEKWVTHNSTELMGCETPVEVLQLIVPKLVEHSENKNLRSGLSENQIINIANMWINGMTYRQIIEYCHENNVCILRRKKQANIELSEIIDICDNGFGYASTLIINAISELMQLNYEDSEDVCKLLNELNRMMRYGLPTKMSIAIYEAGFSDRVVALRIATILQGEKIKTKKQFLRVAKNHKATLSEALAGLPSIFSNILETM